MNKCKGLLKMRYLLMLLVAVVAGCASNAQEIPIIPDTVAPTVSFTSPSTLAVNVPNNRKLNVAFSEAMSPASISKASFTLKETVGNLPVDGDVTAVSTSAIFAPLANLKVNTNYTATIKGGTNGVKDLAGNPMANDFVFTFTTGLTADITAPTVSVTSPTDTAIAVPVNRKVTVGFSEEMDPATIGAASFTLKETVSGLNVPGVVTHAGTSAILTPSTPLKLNIKYSATIKGGNIIGVKDLASNAMVSDFVFTFTTGLTFDTTAPILITTAALDGATGLPVNRTSTATFSEPMNPATLVSPATSFTVKETLNSAPVAGVVTYIGNTATFTPNTNLKPLTQYTSTISIGATDLAGNALIAGLRANPWNWTTGPAADVTPPTVTVTNPANLAIDVPVNNSINATFNEAMSLNTMTTANFTLIETGVIGNIPGTVAYDVQNKIATFTPQSNLKPFTNYTVTVTNGATDLAGNALVVPAVNGLPVPNPWVFRTAAAIIPPQALAINLRSANTFGIAARAGLTSTGVTVVNGDVALSPLAGCVDSTGNAGASQACLSKIYSSPTGMAVNGSIYWAGDPFDNGGTANSVTNDLNVAWTEGMNKVDTLAGVLLGELGAPGPAGKIIIPGVYNEANLGLAAGFVATFDALNNANAIFIIKVGTIGGAGDFTDSGTLLLPTQIKLVNGAQAKNIWFVVGRDITIGSGTTWNGNILAGRTAVVNNGSTVVGRVLAGAAGAGAITLTGAASPSVTTISVPQ